MVQEVYDKRVLHRMLGVTPQSSLLQRLAPSEHPGRSRAEGQASVRSAWEEADMDLGSEDGRAEEDDEDDESRYDIDARRQPPKKRRRTGRLSDVHTVFTTDDDDVDDDLLRVHGLDDDGLSEEEREYDLSALGDGGAGGDGESDGKSGLRERKRSYWLSKALAMNGSGDD